MLPSTGTSPSLQAGVIDKWNINFYRDSKTSSLIMPPVLLAHPQWEDHSR